MKAPQIILQNYEDLLSEVKNHVEKTAQTISKIATRKKVEMAWNIGRCVQNYLEKNNQSEKSTYGKHLFERLQSDVGIEKSVLYRMRSFYKSYPELPQDSEKLNWNHYRILSGIKDEDQRKYLQDLTSEENLSAEQLNNKLKKIRKPQTAKKKNSLVKKLEFKRGKLFCYKVVEVVELGISSIDCGFGIFHQIDSDTLPGVQDKAQIIETQKNEKGYSVKKSSAKTANLNAYKAYLRRVVDGDTIHVVLDLGFKIFHEEILRLRQIDAAEISTKADKKSALELKKILQNLLFLIVKTHATDTYGRYLADVFIPDVNKKMSAEEVVENGEYLSQILLDKNLAEKYS